MSQILKKTDDEFVANTKQKVLDEIEQIVYFGLAKKGSISPTSTKICKTSPHYFHNLFQWFYLVLFKPSKLLQSFAWKVFFWYVLHPDPMRIWKCYSWLYWLRKAYIYCNKIFLEIITKLWHQTWSRLYCTKGWGRQQTLYYTLQLGFQGSTGSSHDAVFPLIS